MPDKVLGTMRCPIGALVRMDDAAKSFVVEPDGWVGDGERAEIERQVREDLRAELGRDIVRADLARVSSETDRRSKALSGGRVRCVEEGPVSAHSKDPGLIVVLCQVHGAVEARADIWKGEVS